MKVSIDKKAKTMTIVLPLEDPPTLSSTGKNMMLATTRGNKLTDASYDGQAVTVSVNAYYKPK